jgi:transposase
MADKNTEAAVVDENNKVLGTRYLSTTRQGYRQMLAWMTSFGALSAPVI